MNNIEIIKKNIIPGDILLSRNINGPISEIIDGVIYSKWDKSSLYIGENKVITNANGELLFNNLEEHLDTKFSVGLFRIQPKLSITSVTKVIKFANKMARIQYGYFWLFYRFLFKIIGKKSYIKDMSSSVLLAKVYKKVGIDIKDIPTKKIKPIDFDNSSLTIRIT